MRKYSLASLGARSNVDLRDYSDVIESAVHEAMPDAVVSVECDCYYVSPTPSQADAVRIGRRICKSALNKHCVHIPKLFSSIEVKNSMEVNNGKTKSTHGGHY